MDGHDNLLEGFANGIAHLVLLLGPRIGIDHYVYGPSDTSVILFPLLFWIFGSADGAL